MTGRTGVQLTDRLLEETLRGRITATPAAVLSDIMRAVEATPQRRSLEWNAVPLRRRLVLLTAAAALLVALAGAAAIGARLLLPAPPLPPLPNITYQNGEIVVRGEGCELNAVDPATGSNRVLYGGMPGCYPLSTYELAWAPDGTRLAFNYTFSCGGCGSEEARQALALKPEGIWILDPQTSVARHVYRRDDGTPQAEDLSWSPDGSKLAFSAGGTVWFVSADEGSARPMETDPSAYYSHPVWSPRGDRIAYAQHTATGPNSVVVSRPNGAERIVVVEFPEQIEDIAWSHDGQSILYATNWMTDPFGVAQADGSGGGRTFNTGGFLSLSPRWSPDRSHIAFIKTEPQSLEPSGEVLSKVQIWTLSTEGHRQLLYTAPWPVVLVSDLTWSPDSQYITFSVTRADTTGAEGSGTYLLDAAGEGAQLLTLLSDTATAFNELQPPAWQPIPDGSQP